MSVRINYPEKLDVTIEQSDTAKEAIRYKFNPSGLDRVNNIKELSSAFITLCEQLKTENPAAGREFAVAITEMQTASMWAVLGATKGL